MKCVAPYKYVVCAVLGLTNNIQHAVCAAVGCHFEGRCGFFIFTKSQQSICRP